ncbi:MAG TPA: GntR family transcriptional regulator [Acidimicrobiales bacterium]|nr:GntR family transcriptional regulator [Acidimicrobiales bacterium]
MPDTALSVSEDGAVRPNRRALSEWALDQIYEAVFTGAMSPGDPISEEEITKRLGVSRSPAREALRELEAVGIVEVNSVNGRRVVAKFGANDIYDLYTVRSGLEELGARYAAPKATPELIKQLRMLQDQMEQAAGSREYPSRRDFELDFELHRVICRASGLGRLETTLRPLWLQTHAVLRFFCTIGAYGKPSEDAAAYQDHKRIIRALQRRDPDRAAQEMRSHLEHRRDELLRGAKEIGHWFS